jgi:hypothetical protein
MTFRVWVNCGGGVTGGPLRFFLDDAFDTFDDSGVEGVG